MANLLPSSAVLALAFAIVPLQAQDTGKPTRTVHVTVVDRAGSPLEGLGPADFSVKENGRSRTVVAAARTTAPLRIALMLDDSGEGLRSMREGAAAFITRLRGQASIALYTTAGRTLKVLDYTESTAALIGAVNQTFARNTPGGHLTDGIVAVANEFVATRSETPRRTVILSVGLEGVDFSEAKPVDVLAALQKSGAQLYMIRLGRPVMGQGNALEALRGESFADEQTRFNAVLGQVPPRTGGRIEQLAVHSGIPPLMTAIAEELAGQYAVTYAPADLTAVDARLEVSTTRRNVRVRAPTRVGPAR